MCGLFGWNFKRKSRLEIGKREALASILAIANSYRGDKSWGVYAVSKQGAFIKKAVGDICNFSDFSSYGRLPLVMGHTRWPTQGKITEKNSHPFVVGKVILAHNGTVSNSAELDKKHNRSCDVDSEHFAHHLDEDKDFKDIEGYGAITWAIKGSPNRVHLCRLRNGSLSIAGIKNGFGETVGVAWSSDESHLKSAIGAARIEAFLYERMDEGKQFFVEGGALYVANEREKLIVSAPSYRGGYYQSYSTKPYDRGYWEEKDNRWIWINKEITKGDDDAMDARTRLHAAYGAYGYSHGYDSFD